MGYCMSTIEAQFEIKKDKFPAALQAIKNLVNIEAEVGGGGTYSNGTCVRHFSWVDSSVLINADNLLDAIGEWGWEAQTDDNDNITDIYFSSEKLGDDQFLFEALAPFVEAGSYIAMRGEDDCIWRWYFDGEKCIEQAGRVTFDPIENAFVPSSFSNEPIVPEDF